MLGQGAVSRGTRGRQWRGEKGSHNSRNHDHTHGVGIARAWAPTGQDDHHISLLEEPSLLAHFHGEVDPEVDVLGPDVVGRLVVEDGEDPAIQVCLAGGLAVTGHSNDGGAGPVPGDQVG